LPYGETPSPIPVIAITIHYPLKTKLMRRNPHWKLFVASLLTLFVFIACEREYTVQEITQAPGTSLAYTTLESTDGVNYCGSAYKTPMQIGSKAGSNYGTITVCNDAGYLYLTYTLDATNDFYLKEVQSFVGPKELMPAGQNGNPQIGRFPFKQAFETCGFKKSTTLKIPVGRLDIQNDNALACIDQCFVAMHAAVVQIPNRADCASVTKTETSWGFGQQLNGDKGSWAMGFGYCWQNDCTATAPWCAMSQGYWFNKPNLNWEPGYVQFGKQEKIYQKEGRDLWPAKDNWMKKAFFQASAIQLSIPLNTNSVDKSSISAEYKILCDFLSKVTYDDIKDLKVPAGTDINEIQSATGKIGKWICANHCNQSVDPAACAGN
jgi:hypothetical protein